MSWRPYTSRRRSWQSQFHHLKHHKPRPRWSEPRNYFRAVDWPKFEKMLLMMAISKLATEERLTSGPVRYSGHVNAVMVFSVALRDKKLCGVRGCRGYEGEV